MSAVGIHKRTFLNPWSFFYILIFFVPVCLLRFHFDPVNIISWDTFGYYLYLPSWFIYHDPAFTDITWVKHVADQYHTTLTLYQLREIPGGAHVNYYMMGMALAYLPAFMAGHLIALVFGYPADGFSVPYQYSLALEGMLVLLLALFMLRKVLLVYFSDKIVAFVLIILTLGTNFLEMAYGNFHSPHGFLFFGYAILLWLTMRWHEKPKLCYAALLGLLIGWMSLARPVEIVALAIPFFWGIGSTFSFGGKIRFFLAQKKSLLLFGICGVLAVLPQFLYWKSVSGTWIFNTYITGSEGMDLLAPHTLDFLFSFRKGWLVYTPVMAFAIAGFIVVYQRKRELFWPFFVFLFFFVYLYSSWTIWWYAFCFSQRVMIQAYPVLSLLLGFALLAIAGFSRVRRGVLIGLIVAFVALNLFQTWQYTFARVIDGARMTPAYYFRTFGKLSASEADKRLLLVDRSNSDQDVFADTAFYLRRNLLSFDFEEKQSWYSLHTEDQVHGGRFAMKMDSNNIYTVPFLFCFKDLTTTDHAWVRVSFFVFPVSEPAANPFSLVMQMQHGKGLPGYKYRTANIEEPGFRVMSGQWNKVVFDYLTPEARSVEDTLAIYFWHRGKLPVFVDDLVIDVFSPDN